MCKYAKFPTSVSDGTFSSVLSFDGPFWLSILLALMFLLLLLLLMSIGPLCKRSFGEGKWPPTNGTEFEMFK
jgi:hypothetical protein